MVPFPKNHYYYFYIAVVLYIKSIVYVVYLHNRS